MTEADAKYATLPFIGRSLPQTRFATFWDGRRTFHFYKHFGLIDVDIFDETENGKVTDFNLWLVDQAQRVFGAQLHRSLFFLLSHLHFGLFRGAKFKTSDSIFVRDIFIISSTSKRSKYIGRSISFAERRGEQSCSFLGTGGRDFDALEEGFPDRFLLLSR